MLADPLYVPFRSLRLLENPTIACPQAEIAVNNDSATT
jgi:hypothetical protein